MSIDRDRLDYEGQTCLLSNDTDTPLKNHNGSINWVRTRCLIDSKRCMLSFVKEEMKMYLLVTTDHLHLLVLTMNCSQIIKGQCCWLAPTMIMHMVRDETIFGVAT